MPVIDTHTHTHEAVDRGNPSFAIDINNKFLCYKMEMNSSKYTEIQNLNEFRDLHVIHQIFIVKHLQ